MDLDVEVQNTSLDSWLDTCISGSACGGESENSFFDKEDPPDIPEISERDVTSEIEKLTSAEDIPSLELLPSFTDSEVEREKEPEEDPLEESGEGVPALGKEEEMEVNRIEGSEGVKKTEMTPQPQIESIPNELRTNGNLSDVESDDNESGDADEPEQEDQGSGEELDSGEEHESEEHESGEEHATGEEHESGDEDVESGEENEALDNEDERESVEENEEDASCSVPVSPKLSETLVEGEGDKIKEDGGYAEDTPANILEPTCELAESEDFDQGLKSRFNLRKRSHVQVPSEEYVSDEYDPEVDEPPPRKLKFNFSKKNYRRQRPYTNEAVKEAVRMVQSKRMSILEASRKFDIPRTSLHNFVRLYKRGRRMGVKTISPGLTKQEESEMVSLVIKLSRCGKRYSHNELRFLIQYYLINNDRPVFKSGTLPTMGWIAGLVERQPDLTKAKSKKNTKVAVEDVEEWQKQIEDYLINDWDLDIDEIFRHENGHRIFCFNAFKMTINGPAEYAENKTSPVKKEPGTEEEKDQEVSAILGMSADGGFVVPLVVLAEEVREMCPPSNPKVLRILFNKTGRVDEDVALRIVRDFDEEITNRGIPKPVVFFVNDKQDLAHFSVIEYCWENQIVIICLPPKTCKTMTPFEVSIWPKIRSSYATLWKNAAKDFDNKIAVGDFPHLFLQAWETAAISKQAMRGFTKSGLIPLDVPAILGETAITSSSASVSASAVLPPEQIYEDSESQMVMPEVEDSVPEELCTLEDRSRGKLEGIQMCLEAIESFIPADVIPVWNERGTDYRGRSELAFKLWRSVSLLLKAGCAMASIQQMADGFFNPFASDFSSTASFFQKTPISNSHVDSRPESPVDSTVPSPPPIEKPMPKKRKLNKSIYSKSAASMMSEGMKPNGDTPFVKLYPNSYMMGDDLDDGE